MTFSTDLALMIDQCRYELQYVDYEPNEWTVPVILTEERAKKIIQDEAIARVRITPIVGAQTSVTWNYYDLVYHTEEQRKEIPPHILKP